MGLRLMAVHAHPDDESSKGAATDAYYLSRGVRVRVVSCTGGEGGDILNETLGDEARWRAARDMAGLRRVEMAAAQRALGIEHDWLGYVDSGMAREDGSVPRNSFADIPTVTSTGPLVRAVRAFRPHVIVTYDENGGYPHPDHIRCHDVSVAAWAAAGDPAAYPDAGAPWTPLKLYYDRGFNPAKMRALYDVVKAERPDSPFLGQFEEMRKRMAEMPEPVITTQIDIGAFYEARDGALRAHASQIAPDSPFFFLPDDLQRRAWPYDDYQLVESRVDVPPRGEGVMERDLFGGIPEDAS